MDRVHARLGRDMVFALSLSAICLLGILSQPYLGLSAFWPANAFMLGMLVRFPGLNRISTWIYCAAGFFLADLVMGASLARNLMLNGGNLATVATACYLLLPLSRQDRRLKGQESTLYVLRAILIASLVAGLIGIFVNPLLFGGSSSEGFLFWTVTEMVNYVTFLPILLTLPHPTTWHFSTLRSRVRQCSLRSAMPLLALIASVVIAILIGGGPGTALFPIPALLWCALSYDLFLTALVSLAFALWTLFALRTGLMWSNTELTTRTDVITVRLGVSLVAFTPLVVGSVVAAYNDLLRKLRFLADYDAMTGLLNRRAFLEVGGDVLARSIDQGETTAIMMLDIDHFKSINDRFGHKAGDQVLVAFAHMLKGLIRSRDIVGRLGGEEFAIVMPNCSMTNGAEAAKRINHALRSTPIMIDNRATVPVTVSIGLHVERKERALESPLIQADEALYRAKSSGRDRFELSRKASSMPAFVG